MIDNAQSVDLLLHIPERRLSLRQITVKLVGYFLAIERQINVSATTIIIRFKSNLENLLFSTNPGWLIRCMCNLLKILVM